MGGVALWVKIWACNQNCLFKPQNILCLNVTRLLQVGGFLKMLVTDCDAKGL